MGWLLAGLKIFALAGALVKGWIGVWRDKKMFQAGEATNVVKAAEKKDEQVRKANDASRTVAAADVSGVSDEWLDDPNNRTRH